MNEALCDIDLCRAFDDVVLGGADEPIQVACFDVLRIDQAKMPDAGVRKLLCDVRTAAAQSIIATRASASTFSASSPRKLCRLKSRTGHARRSRPPSRGATSIVNRRPMTSNSEMSTIVLRSSHTRPLALS